MKIYVASSWRNTRQNDVVAFLRKKGHIVYDKNGDNAFKWEDIDPNWKNWSMHNYLLALDSREAIKGFRSDMQALNECDACVYVLPCGRGASLELGWAVGAKKITAVLLVEGETELMIKMADFICTDIEDLENKILNYYETGVKFKI